MKKFLPILFTILFNLSYSQSITWSPEYFSGNKRYCEMNSEKNLELWKLGFQALQNKKFYKYSSAAFLKIIKTDTTNCDAYFMAGYTFRIRDMLKESLVYYYMADSLAQNKAIEFKQNLATTCLLVGNVEMARKKYSEIVKYFPENPEGYYGIALTSTIIGDVEFGLENMNKAVSIYSGGNKKIKEDSNLLLGILLSRNKKFSEALPYFEECYSNYKKDDEFNTHYSYSLLKVAEITKDEKMKQKALKIFEKIKNKDAIQEEIKNEFKS